MSHSEWTALALIGWAAGLASIVCCTKQLFLGMGSKSVALPASRVDISQAYGDQRVVKIDATKEELVAAPAFKTREVMKAEADEQAARARSMQNMPSGAVPGAPSLPRSAPSTSGGSSTQ